MEPLSSLRPSITTFPPLPPICDVFPCDVTAPHSFEEVWKKRNEKDVVGTGFVGRPFHGFSIQEGGFDREKL